MEYRKERIILIICLIIFVVCMALVIGGQKNIGYPGLGCMLAGLAGLLILLGYYNHKHNK
ncbi:MAG: hypothetical protein PHE06_11405 [Lachnospiraceae bacterium]|nr:hypothetical protein [Lachnospiraceae bacterium]MDD3796550.1 hypothetical protein [Lachnospiraceae bacterium]